MAILKYTDDDGVAREVLVDAADPIAKIGRHKECSIITNNNTVSRRHCQIVFTGNEYLLSDLGSSNGTFVRGDDGQNVRLTAETTLVDKQVFFCGNFQITFHAGASVVESVADSEDLALEDIDFEEPESLPGTMEPARPMRRSRRQRPLRRLLMLLLMRRRLRNWA